MRAVSSEQVSTMARQAAGCAEYEIDSTECLSALIRIAASLHCPCPERVLVNEVREALAGVCDADGLDEVASAVRTLVAYGDLIEAESGATTGGQGARLIYARPPSFVRRLGDSVVVLGVGEMDRLPLPIGLQSRLVPRGYTRRLEGDDVAARLLDSGFIELDSWGSQPEATTASSYLAEYDRRLDGVPDARDIAEFRVLDPDKSVRYYLGRWVEPKSSSGRFVARRPQAYGNELWCYMLLEEGRVKKVLDIVGDDQERACDTAWRLQAAIDCLRGKPQAFSVSADSATCRIRLYSPVPQWAQRRWDILGEPISEAFLQWSLSPEDLEDERSFARDILWLQEVEASGPSASRGD